MTPMWCVQKRNTYQKALDKLHSVLVGDTALSSLEYPTTDWKSNIVARVKQLNALDSEPLYAVIKSLMVILH